MCVIGRSGVSFTLLIITTKVKVLLLVFLPFWIFSYFYVAVQLITTVPGVDRDSDGVSVGGN